MEAGYKAMKRKAAQVRDLPVWPAGKPIPSFRTLSEEERFWMSYQFEDDLRDEGWNEIIGPRPPQPVQHHRVARRRSS